MKGDNLDETMETEKDEKNFVESLLDKIPGLSGYREKNERREADRALRAAIASEIDQSRLALGAVHQELSRDIIKAMNYAEDLGAIDTRLMGLAGKINDAAEGYAGFFAANKIEEDDLEQVAKFDAGMVEVVETINAGISTLNTAVNEDGDIEAAIKNLNNSVIDANNIFSDRNNILNGVSE